ncbi:endonuclease/exonuclease/phosphatase family protein [Desulforhopalus sp. 52FAK]
MRYFQFSSYVLLLLITLAGCARIPVETQFVSVHSGFKEIRNAGVCDNKSFKTDGEKKEAAQDGLFADRIPILSWNIYKGLEKGWQEDLQTFGGKSDLVLLQEALFSPLFESFFEEYGFSWNFNSAFRYNGFESGVLLASRVVPLQSCGLRRSEPIIRIPKTIVVSSFAIKNSTKQLLVANVHAINFTLGTVAYKEQFETLEKVLEVHSGPLLLAGDFNDWSDERSLIIARLAEALSLTVLPFMQDDDRTRFFGEPVDHIFYRGLEPVQFDVHSVRSSDHNPIFVAFRVKDELK